MHGVKVLPDSVLCHNVNEYDVITTVRLSISVDKYNKIINMVFLWSAHSNQHIYVIKWLTKILFQLTLWDCWTRPVNFKLDTMHVEIFEVRIQIFVDFMVYLLSWYISFRRFCVSWYTSDYLWCASYPTTSILSKSDNDCTNNSTLAGFFLVHPTM